ncbi:unnamed protein product [Boreogadus saida]
MRKSLSQMKVRSVITHAARRPEGEVVEGVYRRYAPAGARERPLRNSNQHNGEHLRQRGRRIRYPLKGRLLFSQEREPGVRAEQRSTSRTRYGLADSSITDFSQWPREKPHARTTRAGTTRTTGTASLTGVTSLARDETGPAGDTIPLDTPWLTESPV